MRGKELDEETSNLEDFIKDNYQLFNFLSVFGAITLLIASIARLESTANMERIPEFSIRIGMVGSLLLFITISFIINKNFLFFAILDTRDEAHFGIHFILNISFIFFFNMVVVSITTFVFTIPQASSWILYGIGVPIASSIWFYTLKIYDGFANPYVALFIGAFMVSYTFGELIIGDAGILTITVNTGIIGGTAGYIGLYL